MSDSSARPVVPCPRCGLPVIWDAVLSPARPFCSDRCREQDLAAWASGDYTVPGESTTVSDDQN